MIEIGGAQNTTYCAFTKSNHKLLSAMPITCKLREINGDRSSAMHCRHCHSEMKQTDTVFEGRALQIWYECPLCSAQQTVSQPCEAQLRRIGSLQRCSSRPTDGGCGISY